MNNVGSVGNIGTLPLVLRRDELAGKIYRERNNPHAHCEAIYGALGGKSLKLGLREQSGALHRISREMSESVVVVWRGDLFDAALYNANLFGGSKLPLSLIPSVPQWWPSEALKTSKSWRTILSRIRETRPDYTLQGILVSPYTNKGGDKGEKFSFAGLELESDGVVRTSLQIAFVATLKGMPRAVLLSAVAGDALAGPEHQLSIVAALSFMNQEFVDKKTTRYPARFSAFRQKYVPFVHQVILRAKHSDVVPGSQADAESHREYEHSWTVRGHWRKLHEPRRVDGQQVVWVRPHIKGDPEKPLLPPKETIIKVCR